MPGAILEQKMFISNTQPSTVNLLIKTAALIDIIELMGKTEKNHPKSIMGSPVCHLRLQKTIRKDNSHN